MADDLEVRLARLEERIEGMRAAVELQAAEYERRLQDLNHSHDEARKVQSVTVTRDRFDEYVKTEAEKTAIALRQEEEKRVLALLRVDEKFDDYITRYEQDKRETDRALDTMRGAAEQAKRTVEDQARKTNRNIGIVAIALTAVIGLANYIGSI